MDYLAFAAMEEEELKYLSAFDIASDPDDCKAIAALYILREYIPKRMELEREMREHAKQG